MGSQYDHLTLDERRLIFRLREAKAGIRQIAERLGRYRSRATPRPIELSVKCPTRM
jgi:IS30 family transposase